MVSKNSVMKSPIPLSHYLIFPPRRSCVFYAESSVDLGALGISYSIYKGPFGRVRGASMCRVGVVALDDLRGI